jgi:hypothetical protein
MEYLWDDVVSHSHICNVQQAYKVWLCTPFSFIPTIMHLDQLVPHSHNL